MIGDQNPSCQICGKDSCIGFKNKLRPLGLEVHLVQSAHTEPEPSDSEVAEDEKAQEQVSLRAIRRGKDRARKPALDTARHPAGDR